MQSAWCTFEPNFNVIKILKKCHFQNLDLMNQNVSNHEHAEYDPNRLKSKYSPPVYESDHNGFVC